MVNAEQSSSSSVVFPVRLFASRRKCAAHCTPVRAHAPINRTMANLFREPTKFMLTCERHVYVRQRCDEFGYIHVIDRRVNNKLADNEL